MPFGFYVDQDTNDLVLKSDGSFKMTEAKPEITRQRLTDAYKTWTGEWINDLTYGALDRDFIFGKGITRIEADAWFKSIALSFEDVERIVSWESEVDKLNRAYKVWFEVEVEGDKVKGYYESARPNSEVAYTDVPEPTDEVSCEFDNLVDLANRLHRVINEDFTQSGWIFSNNTLNPLGVVYTDRIIEV